jgi:hypothetical protein
MFGWSVKSVPGCFVLIAPSTIVDPVALTPGFGPQDDVLALADEPEPPPAVVDAPPEDAPAAELGLEVVLLLLPHPASAATTARATSAAGTTRSRARVTA